jgi:hypothetical protein
MLISLTYREFILISNRIKEVPRMENKGEGDNGQLALILPDIAREILRLII